MYINIFLFFSSRYNFYENISFYQILVKYNGKKCTSELTNCREEEADLTILVVFSFRLLLATGYFWLEAIMEIHSRHIGNQERPGLPALLSSPFRSAVFLWQLANMFPSFCDEWQSCHRYYRLSRIP